MNGHEKSGPVIVAIKPANEAGRPAEEWVEPSTGAGGNVGRQRTHRAQNRVSVSPALDHIREAARLDRTGKFTALLHHVDIDLLRLAFLALKRDAAPGADGDTWSDYARDLEPRLADLHMRVHRGDVSGATVTASLHSEGRREAASARDRRT